MTEEKKEGFSYESPEKQKKNAGRLFVLEIGVLAVVVTVVVILLNVLGVISFSGVFSDFFGKLGGLGKEKISNEQDVRKGEELLRDVNRDKQGSVEGLALELFAVSDVSGYSLTMLDKDTVVNLLKDWKVFGKKHNGKNQISNITLHFTDKEQRGNLVISEDIGLYLSSGITVVDSRMNVYVHIAPAILDDATKDISQYYQSQFVTTMYRYGFPVHSSESRNEQEKGLNQKLEEFNSSKIKLFRLEKL